MADARTRPSAPATVVEPAPSPPETNGEELSIAAVVHGRVRFVRPAEAGPAPLLVGFHGYGEDAARLLAELRRIPGAAGWLVASVDAPHPFYNTKTGDVVRSWMTKDDRERAIDDNVAYVASAIAALRREVGPGPLAVAGFSQGVAMTWRAAVRAGHATRAVVALAGDVPPELVADPEARFPPAALLGRGEEDTWYTAEKLEKDVAALAARGVDVEVRIFPGGHLWTDDFRTAAGEFLTRRFA